MKISIECIKNHADTESEQELIRGSVNFERLMGWSAYEQAS